ncbi:hypothetical protein AXG93_473s1110 [Marchantia polymorpha subsp. ruderalis]|uniref:Uncharacterized protein n=1 Tax=Marchantia polymorpha subsp. ruderalis TaxID=1480154 RepID=A0A176W2H8_MARPO|nr:hypothetical protein AXG93_473s1110 [Marchantia polymorpha subsp. ruderalis]
MGGMLLLGVTVWTVLLLSAVHVSSAGEALSAVDSLPCIGSGCGAETVRWRRFTNRAVLTSRKLLLELSMVDSDKISDVDKDGDVIFAEDYNQKSPPPPRSIVTPSGPHPRDSPATTPATPPGLESGSPPSPSPSTRNDFESRPPSPESQNRTPSAL